MLTIKKINTKIRSIKGRNATLRSDIQTVMLNLAGHAYEHGDVSSASKLLDAVTGQDKVAIVRFLRDHCFVSVDGEGTVKLNKKARNDADFVDGDACVAHLEESAPNWWEASTTTQQAAQILDPILSLRSLAKRIAKGDRELKAVMGAELQAAFNEVADAIASQRTLAVIEAPELAEDGSIPFSDAA